jgi:hypothetical protein
LFIYITFQDIAPHLVGILKFLGAYIANLLALLQRLLLILSNILDSGSMSSKAACRFRTMIALNLFRKKPSSVLDKYLTAPPEEGEHARIFLITKTHYILHTVITDGLPNALYVSGNHSWFIKAQRRPHF